MTQGSSMEMAVPGQEEGQEAKVSTEQKMKIETTVSQRGAAAAK